MNGKENIAESKREWIYELINYSMGKCVTRCISASNVANEAILKMTKGK